MTQSGGGDRSWSRQATPRILANGSQVGCRRAWTTQGSACISPEVTVGLHVFKGGGGLDAHGS